MSNNLKVMMVTEGTYPFHHGGVSTWCDILIKNLDRDVDFILYSIIMNPFVTQKFEMPKNSSLIKVPLWGTEEPSEHLDIPFSKVYIAKKKTTDNVIREQFLPLFLEFMKEIVGVYKNPERFGQILYQMYEYFKVYEYKKSFKSEIVWNAYKNFILEYSRNKENGLEEPGSYSIIHSLGWIYRFMAVLNTPVPKVDVTHSAAAAFCGIPCVLAKFEYNAPFILTEHGVYLREQYLSLSQRGYSSFLNTFLIRLIHSVVNLNYFYADQVSPVCDYNTRWEQRFGVSRDKIEVIYNGVDKDAFSPKIVNFKKNKYPTVVSVARVDPVKDIITLMKAAAEVKKEIPDVRFIIYGSVSVPSYFEECKKVKEELNLGDSFVFAGHTSDVPGAYRSGDIVALSSITEGFPYSVVEAMMCGKPVISTDVGGIREALGSCGILVPPRDVEAFAKGIITLINNPELRATLSAEGRERALSHFTIKQVQEQYFESYAKLAAQATPAVKTEKVLEAPQLFKKRQSLAMEKGYALLEGGFYKEAITVFRASISEMPESPAVPVILTSIAEAYNALGEYDKAFNELEKAEALAGVLNIIKPA